jgi:tetratricopeptide (TPR) repeat protein
MNAACRPGLLAAVLLAVALSGPALGDDRADVQAALVRGRKLREDGKYAEAAASYEKARALIPSVFGADSMNMVGIRALLAECYQKMGEYPKAESLYKQALAGNEAMPGGKDHPFTAETLMNLASLHREQSQYAKAEPLYQRALAILEAKLGKDHPYTATALDRLAVIYWDMGQSAKAEPLLQRAAAIKEAKLGKDDPETARTLNNLACFYKDTGRHAKAEPLFLRVLAIDEAKLGKDHPDTAGALANLALVYRETGDYAKAEPPLRRALAIFAARLGKDHPDTARAAGNMANLVGDMGQHARAEPLHRWALESRETKLGKDHPHTAQTLGNLANLHASLGEWDTSAGFRDRNRRAARNYVANTLPILSDREQEQFLATQDEVAFHTALSHGLLRRDHPAESALSAGWVLNGKAVAGQVRAEGILLARESRDPRTGPIAAELTATRQALAALALQSPAEGGAEARAGKLADLAAKEQDLARRLTQLTGRPANAAWVELADVRKALAPSAVLVEIARFDRKKLDWKPGDKFSLGPRYAAWVIPPTGAVRVIDLGEAGPIDAAVKAARTELEASARTIRAEGEPAAEARLRKPLERLAKLVLHPLLPHIGEAETWVVSPDSNLWLVPWAALPLPGGAYAVEKHTVTYLVTGRDLLAAKNGKVRPTAPVVLADPDFDLTSSEAAAITRRLVRDSVDGPRGLPRRFKLGGVARLPGTAMEAAAIAPRLRQYTGLEPRVWTDKQALAGCSRRRRTRG